jgi:hypothetical protein
MRRSVAVLSVCLFAAASISACGRDEEKQASKAVLAAFELTGLGKNLKLSGPDTVEAGLVEIQFKNSAKGDHGLQLVRVDDDHTAADASKAGDAWGDKGKPLPDWIHIEGGVFIGRSGTQTAVQRLEPGNYVAFDVDSDTSKELEVTGEADGELPSTDGRIEALEYRFNTSGLKAGKNQVTFANTGRQPHFALIAPIKAARRSRTCASSSRPRRARIRSSRRARPRPACSTAAGARFSTWICRRAMSHCSCFISDREGGPPHVAKGMVSGATVE